MCRPAVLFPSADECIRHSNSGMKAEAAEQEQPLSSQVQLQLVYGESVHQDFGLMTPSQSLSCQPQPSS